MQGDERVTDWEANSPQRWMHSGLECMARRGPMGSWCGYVRLPPAHRFHEGDYDEPDVDVHGGLTFGGSFGDVEGFWFGFDCAHAWDFVPRMVIAGYQDRGRTYRDINFVRAECERLAEQLAAVRTGS